MNYAGTVQELRQAIAGAGMQVTVEEQENLVLFRTSTRAVCTWVRSTGKLTFQGKPETQAQLEEVVGKYVERHANKQARASGPSAVTPSKRKPGNKKIFVVHGHDHNSRDQLALVLHELGLDPYVLARSETPGLTIIEALEGEIGRAPGAASFGIVLLTPDDVGHARRDGGTKAQNRARQNVVLELGMLLGALGRKNVAVLRTGSVEMPSDIAGLLVMEYRENVREVVPRLCKRLQDVGFEMGADAITRASM